MSAVGDAAGDGNVFMIMSKCQSVISSSSRDLRDTVPTRDSRRDLNEILTVSTSNMHPSSSPSSLRGDRRVHRVPDLPREDKNLHTLRLSQHSSSPCSPRTEASAPVRSPPSSSHVMHRGRPSLRIGSCLARPAPRTRVLRPPDPTSLSAAAVRAALSLLYLSTLALSRQLETLHASLSLYARAFLPPRSAIYRPRLARAADPRVTITNRRTTRTVPVPVPVLRTSTHTGAHRLFSALFVPREAQYRPPRLVLGLTGGPPTSFGGGE